METSILLFFLLGLGLLIGGAELLVRGASRLAAAVRVSPLVIGLIVVAYGTSAPELAVSIQSAYAGQTDIAIGNVVGSNIFNILFILGISAIITPLIVAQQLVRLDVPIMIGVSVLMALMGLDGTIGKTDGLILIACLIAYTVWSIRQSRKENTKVKEEYEQKFRGEQGSAAQHLLLQILFIVVGLVLIVQGAQWLVDGAVDIAKALGVSELVIGLTIVAAGTSLPEVATSIVASIRGERDIAVGNIVGSNIFNILSVLGLSSLVAPAGISVSQAVLSLDIPIMIAVAVACLPVFFHQSRINRWEGALFLGYFIAYMTYLILDATGHEYLPHFSMIMLGFVVPLTVITLIVIVVRSAHSNRSSTAVS